MRCINHPDRKARTKGLCGSCYNRSLYESDPDKKRAMLERKRETWAKRYAARNSDEHALKQKNRHLKHRYGIDLDEYQRLHSVQQNRCAICGAPGGDTRGTRLYVDHDHAAETVRKLLCPGCNTAVGVLEKGIAYISSVAEYLREHAPSDPAWNALARLDLALRRAQLEKNVRGESFD